MEALHRQMEIASKSGNQTACREWVPGADKEAILS